MATIKPFSALRPDPDRAARICELPYDVMSSSEARQIAGDNPLSFLRVSKPEIQFEEGRDPHGDEVYAAARRAFESLITVRAIRQDPQACFYLYRQVLGQHSQVGIVAVASCQDYLDNTIRKHELTRVDKEEDRVRHIETVGAQTGPAFLTYRATSDIDEVVARLTDTQPAVDFTAADSIRHTSWVVATEPEIEFLRGAFRQIPRLYIADGHHRTAAAARVFQARKGTGHSAFFLAVLFPHNQLQILPYNRIVKDLNGRTPTQVIDKLKTVCDVRESSTSKPAARHEVCMLMDGKWYTLLLTPKRTEIADPAGQLDVTLLQEEVLAPIFGIDNPRTSDRISFVGGIRGTDELKRLVHSGEYACAFSMQPTSVDELMAVADQNKIMPPKSTWFEPKLRDAMFCHVI